MINMISNEFKKLTSLAKANLNSESVTECLVDLVRLSLDFLLSECTRSRLSSEVSGKEYFSFYKDNKFSRPVNKKLFRGRLSKSTLKRVFSANVSGISRSLLNRILYSSAISYCCATDIIKNRDRKTPGTFFEILVGHLFATVYGINPERKIQVLNLEMKGSLPTDFVFDLGRAKSRIHLPVKTSTRERIIQVWAHQRVLDGIYGTNRFRGILVCINETNKKTDTNSVVEVCLPGQWAIYQMYIAQLFRVYYFDVPEKYASLNKKYPFIQVKPFSAFFDEAKALVESPLS
jgi:hypothetical protein